MWVVHLSHGEAYQVGSLSIDPVAVEGPGGAGDAGSLWVVYIGLVGVWSVERDKSTTRMTRPLHRTMSHIGFVA